MTTQEYVEGKFRKTANPFSAFINESPPSAELLKSLGYEVGITLGGDDSAFYVRCYVLSEAEAEEESSLPPLSRYLFEVQRDITGVFDMVLCDSYADYLDLLQKFALPALASHLHGLDLLYGEVLYHLADPVREEIRQRNLRVKKNTDAQHS